MTTTKSFSDKQRAHSVFGTALRGHLGFMIAAFIILFITIVVPYLVNAPDHRLNYNYMQPTIDNTEVVWEFYRDAFSNGIYFNVGQPVFIAVVLGVLSLACALSSSHYMHSMKMTDLYHSLPVRREKFLLTNLAVSMLATLGPLLLLTVGTMLGILIAYGGYGWVGSWFFLLTAMDFLTIAASVWVIYTFATLIAVCVGTTFDALALSGVLGFLPTVVYLIGGAVWQYTTYGVVFKANLALRLSPFLFYFERLANMDYYYYYASDASIYDYSGAAPVFIVWALIGAAFLGGAIFLYRRRKSELAGQTQPQGVLQMIAKFFTAFCGAAMFLAVFNDHTMPVRIIAVILASVVIGLLAELILSRGVRSIVKNIKWLAIAGVVYSLLYVGMTMDILGHARYVPDSAGIASVRISYRGRFENETSPSNFMPEPAGGYYYDNPVVLTNPESIAVVTGAHKQTIDEYLADKDFVNYGSWQGGYRSSHHMTVCYDMKNGRTVERRYYDMSDESFRLLAELEDNEDFITGNHPLFFMERYVESSEIQLDIIATAYSTTGDIQELQMSGEEMHILTQALKNDMLSEPLDEIFTPTKPLRGYIRLGYFDRAEAERHRGGANYPVGLAAVEKAQAVAEYAAYTGAYESGYYDYDRGYVADTWIAVTDSYTETLRVLSDFGLSDSLLPDYGKVSEIRITDLYGYGAYYYSESGKVHSLAPGGRSYSYRSTLSNYDEKTSGYKIFFLTEEADIAFMSGKGYDKLLLDRDVCRQMLYMQLCDEDGAVLSSQFIALKDLPADVRSQVALYLEQCEAIHSNPADVVY